jgi:hypothetical protein
MTTSRLGQSATSCTPWIITIYVYGPGRNGPSNGFAHIKIINSKCHIKNRYISNFMYMSFCVLCPSHRLNMRTIKPRQYINIEYIQNNSVQYTVQSCTVRRKTFALASRFVSYGGLSVESLTNIIRLADPLL